MRSQTNQPETARPIRFLSNGILWLFDLRLLTFLFGMVFFVGAAFNPFRIADYEAWRWFQADSQSLVQVKLLEIERQRPLFEGGTLRQNIPYFENVPFSDLQKIDETVSKPYTSQLGLQGLLMAGGARLLSLPAAQSIRLFELLVAGLTSLTLCWLVWWIGRELSFGAAVVLALGLIFSPYLTCIARNLYWVPFTFFLPLIPATLAASKLGSVPNLSIRRLISEPLVWLGIPLAVFIKCLCGYEFLSNVLLGCALPFLFLGLACGDSFWKRLIPRCAIICLIGASGFLLAFALHIWFVAQVVLPGGNGLNAILERVASNTAQPKHAMFQETNSIKVLAVLLMKYLIGEATNIGMQINFGRGEFYLFKLSYLGAFGLTVFGAVFAIAGKAFAATRLRPLALTTLLAWVCSFSWFVLAKGHQHHLHLNSWMIWLYAMPFSFALIGECVTQAFRIATLPNISYSKAGSVETQSPP